MLISSIAWVLLCSLCLLVVDSSSGSSGRETLRLGTRRISPDDATVFVPWQVLFLRRFALDWSDRRELERLDVESLVNEDSEVGCTVGPIRLTTRMFRECLVIFKQFYKTRRASLNLIMKSSIYSFAVFLLFRRVESWYKGLAKYYVHLDTMDKDIDDYGFPLRRVGTGLTTSLQVSNTESVSSSSSLSRDLIVALEIRCESGIMEDYLMKISKDIATLLSVSGFDNDDVKDSKNDNNNKSKFGDSSSMNSYTMTNFQKVVTVLQARQADLSLRQARSNLLEAVQRCEILASKWKAKAMQRSEGSVKPRFHLIRCVFGNAYNGIQAVKRKYRVGNCTSISTIDRHGQEGENEQLLPSWARSPLAHQHLLVLEKMLLYFYSSIGLIQSHLEMLCEVENAVILSTSVSSEDDRNGYHGGNEAWVKLDEWTTDAYILTTHCLSTMSIDYKNKLLTMPPSGLDDICGVGKSAKLNGTTPDARTTTLNKTGSFEEYNPDSDAYFGRARRIWKLGTVVGRELSDISSRFEANLENLGLQQREIIGRNYLVSQFTLKNMLRLLFLGGSASTGINLARYGRNISATVGAVRRNIHNFLDRRLLTPTRSIINDVLLNKRVSLTDKEALKDSIRSLTVMIDDFLSEHKPKMSQHQRKALASRMDMTPISLEYERELNRPIQNLLSGRIARLVLIQLQFVKKELLVAMQAIDDLFNANQVNLQLLAVTPVIMTIFFAQMMGKTAFRVFKTASRGRMIESGKLVSSNLRAKVRELERILIMKSDIGKMTNVEYGKFLSALYDVHDLLIVNRSNFDSQILAQLQGDLRDLTIPSLEIKQQLTMIERLSRNYVSLLYPSRKAFSISR